MQHIKDLNAFHVHHGQDASETFLQITIIALPNAANQSQSTQNVMGSQNS